MLVLILPFSALISATEQTVTLLNLGERNVLFSDDFRGLLFDDKLKGTYTEDSFTIADDTTAETSNKDNVETENHKIESDVRVEQVIEPTPIPELAITPSVTKEPTKEQTKEPTKEGR
jgi:hypothetical protein